MTRCAWAEQENMHQYHDTEWGRPVHDDRLLFEFITLEGAQAGLSWSTVLKKRPHYKKVFDNFEPKSIAKYSEEKVKELLLDVGIIRNKLKIDSTITNAQAFIKIQQEFGSFDKYIWGFVNNKAIINKIKTTKDIPTSTPLSDNISKDLKKRGFKFVGSTIIYAFMQAVGMVNDHELNCPQREECTNRR